MADGIYVGPVDLLMGRLFLKIVIFPKSSLLFLVVVVLLDDISKFDKYMNFYI